MWIFIACLWYTGTSIHGDDKRMGDGADECSNQEGPIVCLSDHAAHRVRAVTPLGPAPAADAPVSAQSDYAALLVYHGRAPEAVTLLEALEAAHPGDYAVAANLGTAYELAGKNTEALRWIREGIRRNPESHDGTEWLHVKILEAKLAVAADAAWLETHSVLGLDFGDDAVPSIPLEWPEGQSLASTHKALLYQLRERTGFVKPPDPIVGQLLADLASLTAIRAILEHALPVYDLALAYQPPHAPAIRARRDALADMIEARHFWNQVRFWGIVAGVVALIGLLVALIVRRRRKRQRLREIPEARVVSG